MSFYPKLIVIVLVVLAVAQFAPRAVNVLLGLILISMLIMQADKFAALLNQLKL